MEPALVTVSDIIDVINLSSTRRTKETNGQLQLQTSNDAILVDRANADSECLINSQSLGTIIPGEEQTTERQNSQRLCHRLCYHQSKDALTENPVSFLSQQRFKIASLGRSVTLDDFGKRSSDFVGISGVNGRWGRLDEWKNPSDDFPHEPSSSSAIIRNSFDSDPDPFLRRWKSFVDDMGTIISTQGQHHSPNGWNQNERTGDLDDPQDWLRRRPIRNRLYTGSREGTQDGDALTPSAGRSSDFERDGARSGKTRRPGKYFIADDQMDLPRKGRINFKLIAAQLFRPKRSVAPKATDPTVYAFASPLSEELGSLDLVALSREGRDWRTVTEARPRDPTEERILDRLLHMTRLEDETVEMEIVAAERASRGGQCRSYEQPSRQARASVVFGGRDPEVRLARRLGTQVLRPSGERSGVERCTRIRRMESSADPNGKHPERRSTSMKSQLERPDGASEQPGSRMIPTSIHQDCEKLVQVRGHRLTPGDPDDEGSNMDGLSDLKMRARNRKLDKGRSMTVADVNNRHLFTSSVSFAQPPKIARPTKQKLLLSSSLSPASTTTTTTTTTPKSLSSSLSTASTTMATMATTTTTPKPLSSSLSPASKATTTKPLSSSRKRLQSSKKRSRTAVEKLGTEG